MSPVSFGPSDVNNPHPHLQWAHVPESHWVTKVLIFDFDWIVRELANAHRSMPDHKEMHATLEGLKETFFMLRKFEIRLALNSNETQKTVVNELSCLGLANDFDCIRCAEELPALKPSPELYFNVMETMGIRPIKAVAFETSKEGLESAKGAGLFCVTMASNPKGDYVLNSFIEKPILHLLEEIDRLKRPELRKS